MFVASFDYGRKGGIDVAIKAALLLADPSYFGAYPDVAAVQEGVSFYPRSHLPLILAAVLAAISAAAAAAETSQAAVYILNQTHLEQYESFLHLILGFWSHPERPG
jgi:hypothetical protein